jgi:glycosyltransferase involved in cell wall biosynthesis
MREELVTNGCPEEKIAVVPPAVDLALPEEPPVPAMAANVLFVGQLVRGKGVDLLLHALAGLERPFRARILGDGNARNELEALGEFLRLDGKVAFEGWVPHERLGEAYAWARVVAVPSRWPEPFGMVGVEAMGHGRAVVGFDSGGIQDWLADGVTGILVPPRDVTALAVALETVLGDDALASRLGHNGFARARGPFAFDTLVDRLETALGAGSRSGEPAPLAGGPGGGAAPAEDMVPGLGRRSS